MNPPQPASEPYSKDDEVTVYVGEDDPDVRYHGVKCIVITRLQDDLNTEIGRDCDQYFYRVKRRSTGEIFSIDFRHSVIISICARFELSQYYEQDVPR